MNLNGKCVALLLEDQFNEHEVIYPYYRLLESGAKVVVVGSGRSKVFRGKSGLEFEAGAAIDEVSPADFDGVVIPGGYAPDYMRRYPAMVDFVRKLDAAGKVVAAICHAGWMLTSADIVKDRKVTSYFAIKDDLVHAGANWLDQEVVVDGNLITARTPADMPPFLKAILEGLQAGN